MKEKYWNIIPEPLKITCSINDKAKAFVSHFPHKIAFSTNKTKNLKKKQQLQNKNQHKMSLSIKIEIVH